VVLMLTINLEIWRQYVAR